MRGSGAGGGRKMGHILKSRSGTLAAHHPEPYPLDYTHTHAFTALALPPSHLSRRPGSSPHGLTMQPSIDV